MRAKDAEKCKCLRSI